jgi:hypothetical protein
MYTITSTILLLTLCDTTSGIHKDREYKLISCGNVDSDKIKQENKIMTQTLSYLIRDRKILIGSNICDIAENAI